MVTQQHIRVTVMYQVSTLITINIKRFTHYFIQDSYFIINLLQRYKIYLVMHSLSPFYFKQRPNSINLIVKQPQRDSIYLAIY